MYAVLPEYVLGAELAVLLVHTCESAIAGGDALALHEHRPFVRGFSTTVREEAVDEVLEAHSVCPAVTHLFYPRTDCTSSRYRCGVWDDYHAMAGANPNAPRQST